MTLGKHKYPYKRIKRYDIAHYDVDLKKKEKSEFKLLSEARIFARQLFRQNRFLSLKNENGTILTI